MLIHKSAAAHNAEDEDSEGCTYHSDLTAWSACLLEPNLDFYNYFQYGIDILISGSTHVVQKVILHSNVVGVDSILDIASHADACSGSRDLTCSNGINGVHGRSKSQFSRPLRVRR